MSGLVCAVCDRPVLAVITVDGYNWCNDCYQRENPTSVSDQVRWARRRLGKLLPGAVPLPPGYTQELWDSLPAAAQRAILATHEEED